MENLDLYAKVEHLLGFYEAYEELYEIYLDALHEDKTLLDVGCGNGKFLKHFQNRGGKGVGIDLSELMVKRAHDLGVEAYHISLCDMKNQFDSIVAIADVLNYMDKKKLKIFLFDISEHLHKGGSFMCDINTPYGFEEVADGQYFIEEDDMFFAIEGVYKDEKLHTSMSLFERVGQVYVKETQNIIQYYHSVSDIVELAQECDLELVEVKDISLFSEISDKTLLEFKHV